MKRIVYTLVTLGIVGCVSGCGNSSNNLGGATTNYDDNYYNRYNGYDNYDYNDYDDYTDDMYGLGIYDDNYSNSYRMNDDYYKNSNDYSNGGSAYWDGYGINTGRPITDTTTDYNSNSKNLMTDLDDMGNNFYDAGKDIVDGTKEIFEGKNTNTLVN